MDERTPDSLYDMVVNDSQGREKSQEVIKHEIANAMEDAQAPKEIGTALVVSGIPKAQADEFTSKTMTLVSSKTFLMAISDEIGLPKAGETEDDFVSRARSAIRQLLLKLLGMKSDEK